MTAMDADDDLQPTWTPYGGTDAGQHELMLELRQFADEGFNGRHMLGERLLALALHPTLCRADMATASRLSESEVEQLIQERQAYRAQCDQLAAAERVARHMPA
jgi:hypothetical protein